MYQGHAIRWQEYDRKQYTTVIDNTGKHNIYYQEGFDITNQGLYVQRNVSLSFCVQ
jgi:hypothetical protein